MIALTVPPFYPFCYPFPYLLSLHLSVSFLTHFPTAFLSVKYSLLYLLLLNQRKLEVVAKSLIYWTLAIPGLTLPTIPVLPSSTHPNNAFFGVTEKHKCLTNTSLLGYTSRISQMSETDVGNTFNTKKKKKNITKLKYLIRSWFGFYSSSECYNLR